MTREIHDKFEQVCDLRKQVLRDRWKKLGNAVVELTQNHADILDSPNIEDS